MNNHTTVTYFLLLEFSKNRQLQLLHFFLFLIVYLAIATANLLIISAVAFDRRLWTPMYFFLMNLSIQDLGFVSVTVPKSMVNSLMGTRHISYFGCVAQLFSFVTFIASDFSVLTVMAYDRYVAICFPLQYEIMMNMKACTDMVKAVWFSSLLYATLHTSCTFSIPFCSNIVNQFFCEIPQLLKLSCSGINIAEIVAVAASIFIAFGCFIFIIISYAMIFKTVFAIPSVQGRQKAFSTCVPHLIVFSIYFLTAVFAYVRPHSNTPSYLHLALSILYAVLPPLFNPIICSIRNKDIKFVLSKILNVPSQ